MRFQLTFTSDSGMESMITVAPKTIDDIMTIVKNYGHEIIIGPPTQYSDGLPTIEVYDDYRE